LLCRHKGGFHRGVVSNTNHASPESILEMI
jgi:hypothetical protein